MNNYYTKPAIKFAQIMGRRYEKFFLVPTLHDHIEEQTIEQSNDEMNATR